MPGSGMILLNVPRLPHLLCGQVVHNMCITGVHTEESRVALNARFFCQSVGNKEPRRWKPTACHCVAHSRRANRERGDQLFPPYGVCKLGCCHHECTISTICGYAQPHNLWFAQVSSVGQAIDYGAGITRLSRDRRAIGLYTGCVRRPVTARVGAEARLWRDTMEQLGERHAPHPH